MARSYAGGTDHIDWALPIVPPNIATIAFFMRTSQATANATPLTHWDTASRNGWGFVLNNPSAGKIQFAGYSSTTQRVVLPSTASNLNNGAPRHIAVTLNRNSTVPNTLYIDGAQDAQVNSTAGWAVVSSGWWLCSGKDTNAFWAAFVGDIWDIAYWDVQLTAEEIAALAKGVPPRLIRPSNLFFYSPLLRGTKDLRGGLSPVDMTGTTITSHGRMLGGTADGGISDPVGSSTSTLTIPSGKTASNLSNYPVYVNLANMPTNFWTSVSADGGNIRVKQSGSDVPFDVVKIDLATRTGTLFFKAATLLAASNNVFTIETTAGLTMPAVGASNGRNAVWSAFDWVFMGVNSSDRTDRTGGADGTVATGVFVDGTMTTATLGAGCGINYASNNNQSRFNFTGRPSRSVFTMGGTYQSDVSVGVNCTPLDYANPGVTSCFHMARQRNPTDHWAHFDTPNGTFPTDVAPFVVANTPVRCHTVYNNTTNRKWYGNGAIVSTSGAITAMSGLTTLCVGATSSGTQLFNGNIAYTYLRPEALSADYIAAEYANLNAPSSFYAIS